MQETGHGLTKLYNFFYTNTEHDLHMVELRTSQCEMDVAVAHAYGWEDSVLGHDFHKVTYLPENDCVRFTISEPAHLKVKHSLLELSQQRYEKEVTLGLNGNDAKYARFRARRTHRVVGTDSAQPELDFASSSLASSRTADSACVICDFLKTQGGWYVKADILRITGVVDKKWNNTINGRLVADDKVERQWGNRGARYRYLEDGG